MKLKGYKALRKICSIIIFLSMVVSFWYAPTQPVSAADVTLLADSFGGTLANWTVKTGTWSIESGELSQSDTGNDREIDLVSTYNQERVRVQANVKFIDATGSADILLRRSDGLPHNSVRLDRTNNRAIIWVNGKSYGFPYTFVSSTWYTVKVELNGTNEKFYINNVLQLERSDNPLNLQNSVVGLSTSGGHVHFDDFSLVKINDWDRTWSTLLAESKIVKIGRDRYNESNYEYPYIGLAGTTMFVGPTGFTTPDVPYKNLTVDAIRHEPLLQYDYWWNGVQMVDPFGIKAGYGSSVDCGTINGDNFLQSLDVGTGILSTCLNITANSQTFNTVRTQFVDPDGILVMKIDDACTDQVFKFQVTRVDAARYGFPSYNISYTGTTNGIIATATYGSPAKTATLAVKCSGNNVTVDTTNGIISVTVGTGKPAYFYIAPGSSINEADPAAGANNRANTALTNGYTTNYNNTTAWWSNYYGKSSVDIPDYGLAKWYVRSLYYNAVAIANCHVPPGCYATNSAGFMGDVCFEFDIMYSTLANLYTNHADLNTSVTNWIDSVQPKCESIATSLGYPAGCVKFGSLMGYDGQYKNDISGPYDNGMIWRNDYMGSNVAYCELSQALWTGGSLTKALDILQKVTRTQVYHQQYYNDYGGYAHNGVYNMLLLKN